MKRGLKRSLFLISLVLVIIVSISFVYAQDEQAEQQAEQVFDAGTTPDSVFYFVDTTYDNLRLNFASEENKAVVAAEIHNERIAEVGVVAEEGEYESIEKVIADAEEKIKVIQEEIAPEISENIKSSTKTSIEVLTEVKEKVPEEARDAIENAINRQVVQEKKTEIVSEITIKIDNLCKELIGLVGLEEAIKQEPRCDPDIENSPKWLKRKTAEDGEYNKFDEEAKKKFIDEMTLCFNDPRECRCEEIPVKSFGDTCFKIIPKVIKCQFEQNPEACKEVEGISSEGDMFAELPEEFRENLKGFFEEKQEETFRKNAPPECVQAGAKDFDSCSKIMFAKFAPPECVQAGATTREECMKIMTEKYGGGFEGAPDDCLADGKFIGMDECRKAMMKKFLPAECAEANAFTPETCQAIMAKKFGAPEGGFPKGFAPPGGFPPGFQPPTAQVSGLDEHFGKVDKSLEGIENIPSECKGLTQDECEAKTGKSLGPSVDMPLGFAFRDGETVQITQDDISHVSQQAETHVEEINIGEVREEFTGDIASLEAGISSLEQAPAESAAEAGTTGSVILDFMKRL